MFLHHSSLVEVYPSLAQAAAGPTLIPKLPTAKRLVSLAFTVMLVIISLKVL